MERFAERLGAERTLSGWKMPEPKPSEITIQALGDLLGFHGLPVEVVRNCHDQNCAGHEITDCHYVAEIRESLRSGRELSDDLKVALWSIRA